MGHALKDVEQCGFVQAEQALLGGFAEEDVGGFECHLVFLTSMHQACNLFAQSFLQAAATRVGTVLLDERIDFVLFERGENLDVAFGFGITHVEPELIELVRRGVAFVEPHVTLLGFAKLFAVGLGDERTSQGKGFGF